jgi:acetolactate synthase regulatory subunit
MTFELKIMARNESTALPRVLRIVSRQGYALKRLTLQPTADEAALEIFLLLDCQEPPLRLVKLLQKQILVTEVKLLKEEVALAG